jgi:hypothetical protein
MADPHRIGKRLLPLMNDRFSAPRGTYRVVCGIDDKSRVITVVDVAHRREACRAKVSTKFARCRIALRISIRAVAIAGSAFVSGLYPASSADALRASMNATRNWRRSSGLGFSISRAASIISVERSSDAT